MTKITWLHLSDWHHSGPDFNREVVRDALVTDIVQRQSRISADLGEVDFIVFSGDVAHGGKSEEYDAAREQLFMPVLEATQLTEERLIVVPGNHDLDWDTFRLLPRDLTQPFVSEDEVQEWLGKSENLAELLKPFRAYSH